MIDYEHDNCRTSIIDTAIQNGTGSKEDIQLYEQLSMALELIDDDFDIIYSDINEGIDFGITTPYPNGLPEQVGVLFYNTDINYNVNVKEIDVKDNDSMPDYGVDLSHFNINPPERYFAVTIQRE